MFKRLHSRKRQMALVAFGLLASLSLSAQARPVDYGHRENHISDFSIYQDHSYRGHLIRRDRGYHRYDLDRYVAPHRVRNRSYGSHVDYSLSLYSGEHLYRNSHARRRGHR